MPYVFNNMLTLHFLCNRWIATCVDVAMESYAAHGNSVKKHNSETCVKIV